MFCPKCGSTQPDDLNYCKSCGAHLQGVRTALEKPGAGEEFNWNRTWLAETLMTRDEKDRLRGVTSDMKRRREIKAGVITASSGVGLTFVLAAIMDGIIIGGGVSSAAIAILSRLWIVGLIPILVGAALIFNGLFISKRSDTAETGAADTAGEAPDRLSPSETNQLGAGVPFSVTDDTTRHLDEPMLQNAAKNKQ